MADEQPNERDLSTADDAPGSPVAAQPRRSRVSEKADRIAANADGPATAEPSNGHLEGELHLVERGAHDVNVGTLTIHQGGVNNAQARAIDIHQGGISRAEGGDIAVTQGAIAIARGDRVSVEMGAVAVAVGGDVSVLQGFARSVVARDVRIEQGGARTILAGRATFGQNSGAFMVIAGRVDGTIRTVLDWRGALAFGAAFGLVVGLVRRTRS